MYHNNGTYWQYHAQPPQLAHTTFQRILKSVLNFIFKGIFNMPQQSLWGIIKSTPLLNFIFKGFFKEFRV